MCIDSSLERNLHDVGLSENRIEVTFLYVLMPMLATNRVRQYATWDRDFSIDYRTAGETITDAVLTHTAGLGKFFTLVLQPPVRVKPAVVVPRELVFVLDTSGSMQGFPIETSKAIMRRAINPFSPGLRTVL